MSQARYGSLIERVVANSTSEQFTGCWVWTGQRHLGYAKMAMRVGGKVKKIRVIRAVLQDVTGKTGDGMHAGHKCANSACVNPQHLEWQTPKVNSDEMWGRRRSRGAA